MQRAQAPAVAPSSALASQHDSAGGDAPPKQVAQAMERLARAGRIIADIRLGADRLLEVLLVAVGAPSYSAHQHAERTECAFTQEEVAMHRHFQDGEPGITKRPRLSGSNGELEEKTLSEILKNLENEVPNMKIFTYRHLDWSKRASSLASLLDDDFVDPTKELNLQMRGKPRSSALTTPVDQVAVIELLVPSIFRAIISLHPAGSTDLDAVAFSSPTEGGSYLHARGLSVHHVFKHVKEHADKALQYFISVAPSKALSLLLRWITGYQTLFTKVCSKCRRLLLTDKSLALMLPPVHRPYYEISNVCSDLTYHIGCSSYDG